MIEDLRTYSTKLDSKVARYRDKLRSLKFENEQLKSELDQSKINSQSFRGTGTMEDKALLQEQLEATLSEMRKITVERQRLIQRFKLQKKELKVIKEEKLKQEESLSDLQKKVEELAAENELRAMIMEDADYADRKTREEMRRDFNTSLSKLNEVMEKRDLAIQKLHNVTNSIFPLLTSCKGQKNL